MKKDYTIQELHYMEGDEISRLLSRLNEIFVYDTKITEDNYLFKIVPHYFLFSYHSREVISEFFNLGLRNSDLYTIDYLHKRNDNNFCRFFEKLYGYEPTCMGTFPEYKCNDGNAIKALINHLMIAKNFGNKNTKLNSIKIFCRLFPKKPSEEVLKEEKILSNI